MFLSEQWIEMTVYNKLKIAILTILYSQTINALTLEPIQVQSGSGNLLYAEIKFRNADPNAKVEAGLAESQDLVNLGLSHQPTGHLNFYTRRSGDGTGVIVITSTRPMIETELNILLRIKEGEATHVQQIKTPLNGTHAIQPKYESTSINETTLVPQIIVSEKDIALNLPTSAQFQISSPEPITDTTHSLKNPPSAITVAPLVNTNETENTTTTVTVRPSNQPADSDLNKNTDGELAAKPSENSDASTQKNESPTGQKSEAKPLAQPKIQSDSKAHIVKANESLWKIASKIAAETNQSVPAVMQKIKENNQHAFIQGNINRIRQGTALNLAAGYNPNQKHSNAKNTAKVAKATQKQSGKAKYRINQAEMSLVAENTYDSAQGSAKEKSLQNQTTPELSSKVMTAREKTVKLQKNVSQSTLALQHKDQRIQLLNARLAQLQQQLQQQNHAKKPVN